MSSQFSFCDWIYQIKVVYYKHPKKKRRCICVIRYLEEILMLPGVKSSSRGKSESRAILQIRTTEAINYIKCWKRTSENPEVTIPVKEYHYPCGAGKLNDMYVSIDLVKKIIERQLKNIKTRLTDKNRQLCILRLLFHEWYESRWRGKNC